MKISREDFEKELDNLINSNKKHRNSALVSDLEYLSLFLSVYVGNNDIVISRGKDGAVMYTLNSYDFVYALSLVVRTDKISIQKQSSDQSVFYAAIYNLSRPEFITRNSFLRFYPLGKEKIYKETTVSSSLDGIFFSCLTEVNENSDIMCFKFPESGVFPRIFYSYRIGSQTQYRKSPSHFTEIPYLTVGGIGYMTEMLSEHFNEFSDMSVIEDDELFDGYKQSALAYYNDEKRVQKALKLSSNFKEFKNSSSEVEKENLKKELAKKSAGIQNMQTSAGIQNMQAQKNIDAKNLQASGGMKNTQTKNTADQTQIFVDKNKVEKQASDGMQNMQTQKNIDAKNAGTKSEKSPNLVRKKRSIALSNKK